MARRSRIVQDGILKGLPENIANQIGEPSHLSTKPGYTDCWPWQGVIAYGYGRAKTWMSERRLVHNIIYQLKNGPIPESRDVMHLCNVSYCCNPSHLKVGDSRREYAVHGSVQESF